MTIFDGFLTNNNATLINFESIYDNDPYLQKFTEDQFITNKVQYKTTFNGILTNLEDPLKCSLTEFKSVYRMKYMGLEVREWTCQICHSEHDRDINAAINIKNEGLRILDKGTVGNTETEGTKVPSMPAENPTMDEHSVMNLKSSDSMKQELLYKDFITNGVGPVL